MSDIGVNSYNFDVYKVFEVMSILDNVSNTLQSTSDSLNGVFKPSDFEGTSLLNEAIGKMEDKKSYINSVIGEIETELQRNIDLDKERLEITMSFGEDIPDETLATIVAADTFGVEGLYEFWKEGITFGKVEYVESSETVPLPYAVLKPSTVGDKTLKPAIFYFHGIGEIGTDLAQLKSEGKKEVVLTSIIKEWDLDNFNAYIFCPQSDLNWFSNTDKMDKFVNYVFDEYKEELDLEQSTLIGYSAGAQGVIKFLSEYGESLKEKYGVSFANTVLLGPYWNILHDENTFSKIKNLIDSGMGMHIYYTTDDENNANGTGMDAIKWAKNNGYLSDAEIEKLEDTSHAEIPSKVFTKDSDGNGRADIFEKLFNLNDKKINTTEGNGWNPANLAIPDNFRNNYPDFVKNVIPNMIDETHRVQESHVDDYPELVCGATTVLNSYAIRGVDIPLEVAQAVWKKLNTGNWSQNPLEMVVRFEAFFGETVSIVDPQESISVAWHAAAISNVSGEEQATVEGRINIVKTNFDLSEGSDLDKALDEGKQLQILTSDRRWTGGGHWITIQGKIKDEEGVTRYIISDTSITNWTQNNGVDMESGHLYGFKYEDLPQDIKSILIVDPSEELNIDSINELIEKQREKLEF